MSNAAAVVTVGTNTFTTGAMSVSAGGFTQDGVNATATDSVASLSVSGGNCVWDNPATGGTLAIAGNLSVTAGTLNFNYKNVTVGGTLTGNITFYDLIIPTGKTIAMQPSSSLTVLRNLTIQSGGSYVNNGEPLTLGGGTVITGTIADQNPVASLQNLGAVTMAAGGGATAKTQGTALLMSSLNVGASVTLLTNTLNLTMGGKKTPTGAGR